MESVWDGEGADPYNLKSKRTPHRGVRSRLSKNLFVGAGALDGPF